MSMTADRSSTEAARRPHALGKVHRAPQKSKTRPACAHPIIFGSLATLSFVPLLASAHQGVGRALVHPSAMMLGGWFGARCSHRGGDANEPVARLVGALLGTATASGAAHFFYSGGGCEASAAWCVMRALANGASAGCCAVIGGLLGASAWSGLSAPVGAGAGCLVAAVVGAHALSGLSLAPLVSVMADAV